MTGPAAVVVDDSDPLPPYEQVRRQLAHLIAGGDLRPGDRLPPLRQLAGDLGLAVGTVARAYRELEEAGLVTARRGGGTRVADAPRLASPRPPDTDAFVRGMLAAGYDADGVRGAVEAALGRARGLLT